MAVVSMKRMQLCGMKKDRKKILELLQRLGITEVEEGGFAAPEAGKDQTGIKGGPDGFTRSDMSDISLRFRKQAETADAALVILDKIAPEEKKGLDLNGRKEIGVSEYEAKLGEMDVYTGLARRIVELDKKIAELSAEIPKLRLKEEMLKPWETFSLPLNYEGTKTTDMLVGTVPKELDLAELYKAIEEQNRNLTAYDASIISSEKEQTCLAFFVRKEETAELTEVLRRIDFAKAPLSDQIPAKEIQDVRGQIEEKEQQIKAMRKEISEAAENREKLQFAGDYFRMRADKYDVISKLAQTKRTFAMKAFLPAEEVPKLQKKLEDFDVVAEFEDPAPDEEVPVKLKNNGFASPVESIVESYSMPARGETDPSAIMAPFYYICFGLMLSDAAYGLIMVIGTLVLLKRFPRMEESLKKTLTMFFYCGISTTIWGFLFGSFFGDAVNVIATTFFHRPDISIPPLWFEPVNKPMKMLVFSFVVGIIHLFAGLGMAMYGDIKEGKIKDAIFDCVFWYMLVGGCVVYLLTLPMITEMLGLSFILSKNVGTASAVIAAIGGIGIILTSGRESKNWFKRILKGLYGFYGITSYLSDILSYSRLLALGLATSVISTVFNKMGSMLGGSVPGIILFIVVFLVGHAMNIAINALGAYVHTNRLQYVEFFGKFYEGGGRKFSPFGENTKYYKIKEEER